MLDSGTDRVNYGDLLTAPTGFHLDFALGTTYSARLGCPHERLPLPGPLDIARFGHSR